MRSRQYRVNRASVGQSGKVVTRQLRPWPEHDLTTAVGERVVDMLTHSAKERGNGCRWSEIRMKLGGRRRTELVRKVCDRLLDDGIVVEVYENMRGEGQFRHIFYLVDFWETYQHGEAIEASGRDDILDNLGLRDQPEESLEPRSAPSARSIRLREEGFDYLVDRLTGEWS